MKKINKTRSARWLAIGAIALSASSVNASVVAVNLDTAITLSRTADGISGAIALFSLSGINGNILGFSDTSELVIGGQGADPDDFVLRDFSVALPTDPGQENTPPPLELSTESTLITVGSELVSGAFLFTASDEDSVTITQFLFNENDFAAGLGDTANLDLSAVVVVDSVALAVPEPSSFALLALGAGTLITRRRRHAAA